MAREYELIPIEGSGHPDIAAMGIQVGDAIDDLMLKATLPAGWTQREDGSGYWTYILDEKQRRRATYFYKGAAYDRCAFIRPLQRFYVQQHYPSDVEGDRKFQTITIEILDYGHGFGPSIIYCKTLELDPEIATEGFWQRYHEDRQRLEKEAREWLEQNYPNAGWD